MTHLTPVNLNMLPLNCFGTLYMSRHFSTSTFFTYFVFALTGYEWQGRLFLLLQNIRYSYQGNTTKTFFIPLVVKELTYDVT